jgi:hypothetical protein
VARERSARRSVGRLAGHQPQGHIDARAPLPRRIFAQAQLEERPAVARLDEGFDHPTHARRHAACEHAERDFTAAQCGEPEALESRVLQGPRLGCVDHVACARGLDLAPDAVSILGLPARAAVGSRKERLRQRHEALGFEPAGLEPGLQRCRDRGDLAPESLRACPLVTRLVFAPPGARHGW